MRRLLTLALIFTTSPALAAPAPIAGRWKAEDGTAIVTIAPCRAGSADYCGRVTEFLVAEPKGGFRDTKNPDPKLRNRAVLGSAVFSGLVASGATWKGKGYSVKDGRNFTATLSPQGRTLNLKGCVMMFCRTVVWTRA